TRIAEARSEAKADSEALAHRLETRIAEVRAEIAEVRAQARADLEAVEHRLLVRITESEAAIRAELKAEITPLKTEAVVIRWLLGVVLTLQVGIFIKLFVA
ncbi:hypothetical protein, partial [Pararhodospirillum oryzae]|uniref:hypothetical protein n=1 Tax=Pararhodospirillum oryzae TaxID=478448 RepID=UPI001C3F74D9